VKENWYALLIASQRPVGVEQAFRIMNGDSIGRKKKYSKFTQDDIECMESLKSEGYTYRQIGKVYGISRDAVRSRINRRKQVQS
jgi:DNA invertase Pin-like site-specific DNA recombinase